MIDTSSNTPSTARALVASRIRRGLHASDPLIECELLSPGLVFRRVSVTRFRKRDRLERLEILDTAASPHGPQSVGFSATRTGIPVSCRIRSSSPRSNAPRQ